MYKLANFPAVQCAMSVLVERLTAAMTAKSVDQPQLAAAVGCSQGAISQILTGMTHRSRFLPDIAEYLDVPLKWLKGETDDMGALPGRPTAEEMAEELELVPVAFVDQTYGMGASFAGDRVEVDVIHFPRRWLEQLTLTAPAHLAWAHGKGDSMAPTINDNDMVLIDRSERRVEDQDLIWAFTIGEMAMIKRLRIRGETVTILSDNKDVPDDTAHADEIYIVGRITRVVKPV